MHIRLLYPINFNCDMECQKANGSQLDRSMGACTFSLLYRCVTAATKL